MTQKNKTYFQKKMSELGYTCTIYDNILTFFAPIERWEEIRSKLLDMGYNESYGFRLSKEATGKQEQT